MKHVTNFNGWHSANQLNESLVVTVQVGIVLGLLGIKGIVAIVNKLAKKMGEGTVLEKPELKSLIDEVVEDIKAADKSGKSFSALEKELKARVDNGQITKAADIVTAIKQLDK